MNKTAPTYKKLIPSEFFALVTKEKIKKIKIDNNVHQYSATYIEGKFVRSTTLEKPEHYGVPPTITTMGKVTIYFLYNGDGVRVLQTIIDGTESTLDVFNDTLEVMEPKITTFGMSLRSLTKSNMARYMEVEHQGNIYGTTFEVANLVKSPATNLVTKFPRYLSNWCIQVALTSKNKQLNEEDILIDGVVQPLLGISDKKIVPSKCAVCSGEVILVDGTNVCTSGNHNVMIDKANRAKDQANDRRELMENMWAMVVLADNVPNTQSLHAATKGKSTALMAEYLLTADLDDVMDADWNELNANAAAIASAVELCKVKHYPVLKGKVFIIDTDHKLYRTLIKVLIEGFGGEIVDEMGDNVRRVDASDINDLRSEINALIK